MRMTISLALFLALTACNAESDTASTANKSTDAASSLPTGSVDIGFLNNSNTDGYCTFDADDASSKKRIFVTPNRGRDTKAMMNIGGKARKLTLVQLDENSNGETRFYMTEGGDEIMVQVNMITGSQNGSITSYTGSMRVVAPITGPAIEIFGSCGG